MHLLAHSRQFHPLTTYLYATLMAGYRRLGRVQDCFTIFGVVQQHAVQPSAIVFAILQQACWGHLDATGEVRQILRLMEDMNVQPETSNYNALIRTYSDSGQFTNALQVANRLREAGVAWNEFTYTYLLFAAVNAGQVELGVRLLSQVRSDGVRPSSKQYITVFLGLAKSGYYEDAIRVFERLVSLGSCGTEAFNVMIGDLLMVKIFAVFICFYFPLFFSYFSREKSSAYSIIFLDIAIRTKVFIVKGAA